MRRKDEFDAIANAIVFDDDEFREALESGDDAALEERLAQILRENFGNDI